MTRLVVVRLFTLVAAAILTPAPVVLGADGLPGPPPPDTKPNIIFILADDYGTGEVSGYGADHYKTPNIDALARGGIRFTNAYTAPLCGPSRALIMTGRYAFRTGATNQDATGEMKPTAETMMPKVLKPAGYVSAAVGKWGQLSLGPGEFGFDEYLKFTGSGVYWNTQEKGKTYVVNGETKTLRDKEYEAKIMAQYTMDVYPKMPEGPPPDAPAPDRVERLAAYYRQVRAASDFQRSLQAIQQKLVDNTGQAAVRPPMEAPQRSDRRWRDRVSSRTIVPRS